MPTIKKISLVILLLTAMAGQPSIVSAYGIGVPPVTGLGSKIGRVLGITTATCSVPAVDKKAPDYIRFNQAPAIVKQHFREIFGRSITHNESVYWKQRVRCDLATESKLRDAMTWHWGIGSFGPKADQASKISVLITRLNSIFRSVYSRNPIVSEHGYWITRIADKLSVPALRDTMLFHLWNKILH